MSLFISFEGVEGSGKSTQINLLQQYFNSKNKEVTITKEPGGTSLGIELRKILLDSRYQFHSQYTEILFFTADRLEHIAQVIKPSLTQNKIVICDRFIDSTVAYQEGGRQISGHIIDSLLTLVDIKPDITFLLDIDTEKGLLRARKRVAVGEALEESEFDRFEHEQLQFHHRIRNRYLKLAKEESDRIKVISITDQTPEIIFQEILTYFPKDLRS